MKKKAFLYFGFSVDHWVPFSTFPEKAGTYYALLDNLLELNFDVYVIGGRESYLGDKTFSHGFQYFKDGVWKKQAGPLEANVIFDRTPWVEFPTTDCTDITLNSSSLKALGNDKVAMLSLLQKYTKPFSVVHTQEELEGALTLFPEDKKIAAKPQKGIKGRGIYIDTPQKILGHFSSLSETYLLQELIDTSYGIPGITPGVHDLRFIIANQKIILSSLRLPKEGSLLANVALGGSIREVPLSSLPKNILETAESVRRIVDEKFGLSYFSIDFGIENGIPFLFEINDRIGFPRQDMPSALLFAKELAQTLAKKSS